MNLARLILFTALIPGFVVVYIPFTLHRNEEVFDLGVFKYFGLLVITLGVVFYTWSALSFLLKGKGTPSIWFTKRLKQLIGEEPVNLVSSGLYNLSRNPMYLGVLVVICGQAIFFESKSILSYTGILAVFFHLIVVLLEEPHLKKKYGQDYIDYINKVPRWIGQKEN